jgi:hypothetical protein
MTGRFVVARAALSVAFALLIGLGSVGAFGPDVALAKKKNKNAVEVVDVVVCHILREKKRSGPSLGETETHRSDDKALKNTDKYKPGSCESLGIPTQV